MRSFVVAISALFIWMPTCALAQLPPIVTPNPVAYVEDVSTVMSRTGVRPLRDIYMQIYTGSLPANVEGSLVTYERAIGDKQSILSRVVEVTSLADTFTSVYTYNYYGANAWIFTRFDFVRISDSEWALSAVAFSSEWSYVAVQTTPGFASPRR